MKTSLITFGLILSLLSINAQVPSITSFTPASGAIGTIVTITGTNFNTTAGSNIVYFGSTQATVTDATATSLTVTVPNGAGYSSISVTANNATGYSAIPFIVTNPGGGSDFTASSYIAAKNFAGGGNLIDADFDGDGKIDVVYSVFSENRVFVHRNTGSTSALSFPSIVYFTGGLVNVLGLAKGDFNNDGKLDFVASTLTNGIYVYRNGCTPGNLFFFGPTAFGTGAAPRKVAVADFDGDGKLDIVTSNQDDNTVSVFRNTTTIATTISFAAKVDFPVSALPEDIATGDLDGDGKPEIAVSCSNANAVSILRNTTTGSTISFAAKTDLVTQTYPWGVAIGDLDNDGKAEVVASNLTPNTLSVFKNNSSAGSLSFLSAQNFTTASSPRSVKIGDLNHDGKPDLATACYFSGSYVSVLKNNGTTGNISFTAKTDYGTGTGINNLILVDMNNDGLMDILTANSGTSGGSLSYLMSQVIFGTGVKDLIDISAKLSVFPNPSVDRIIVNHPVTNKADVKITVSDINGKLVQSTYVKPQTKQTLLNISNLTSGIFFIKWFNGKEIGVLKLTKQ